ncbi:polyprenyl synthetase family protein [Bacteroidales bacterium OttesenSCG-928-L03]|nr:polyprenyl synthetase family protein [Bacteroidales bacterium OttesenSCG-928-L03]
MDKLTSIIEPIRKELEEFNHSFKESLMGHSKDYQEMLNYVSLSSGKHIRPILLLLSAKLCGTPNSRTIDSSVIIELIHTMTLIHDDVVDNTMERRKIPSVNARFDNRMAVLLGDYILTIAIVKGVAMNNRHILELLSKLSRNLVDGELSQLVTSQKHIIDEQRYFEVIRKKTALLLSSSTEMGAISVDANKETQALLREIGENLGTIFQIKDDIFDYFEQGELGKPTGNDIREGKITLPLIHALKVAPTDQSAPFYEMIDRQDFTPETIAHLTDFAKAQGGIEYAEQKMQEIKEKTLRQLDVFPDSEVKEAFRLLIDFIIDRKQ